MKNENFGRQNIYNAGIDKASGNKIKIAASQPQWISPSKLRLPSGKVCTIDPMEQCFEMHNGSNDIIILEDVHPHQKVCHIRVLPDEFAFVPHKYFTIWLGYIGNKSGEVRNITINHGDSMFKGNKKK